MLKIKTSNYELHKKLKQRPRLTWLGVGGFMLLAIGASTLLTLNHQHAVLAAKSTAIMVSEPSSETDNQRTAATTSPSSGSTAASAGGGAVNTSKKSVASTSASAVATVAATAASWVGIPLFADPSNTAATYAATTTGSADSDIITRLGRQPVANWFGDWNSNVTADVATYVGKAAASRAMPVLVAYNIPNRDCGGYSAGGTSTEAAYASWITQFASGIGNNPAVVLLEPDSLSLQDCLNADQLAARNRELTNAIKVLAGGSQTRVYLDAGHSGWIGADEMAKRLKAAGVAATSGFALNISNFTTTASNVDYGSQVSRLIGGKHFVIDTSRNGNGPTTDGQWCNPAGRALGAMPTSSTGNPLVDAYLWVKTPWQSDGACNGAPSAGADFWSYAISLAQAAGW